MCYSVAILWLVGNDLCRISSRFRSSNLSPDIYRDVTSFSKCNSFCISTIRLL